jgi:hypothetical protein
MEARLNVFASPVGAKFARQRTQATNINARIHT